MSGQRWSGARLAMIAQQLSERDQAVLSDVARVRVLTGQQVERLYFAGLSGAHRDRTRRRALERLVGLGLLSTLDRRIGGVRAGSAGLIYCLAEGGQRWSALRSEVALSRSRKPVTPTERFMVHNLIISELYVALREAERAGSLTLAEFLGEPASWWRSSDGEWIKPDALLNVSREDVEDVWAFEADNATESVPTLLRKLRLYLRLAMEAERGPYGGLLPRVLISVPNVKRLAAVGRLIRSMPEPAGSLFAVALHQHATDFITKVLQT